MGGLVLVLALLGGAALALRLGGAAVRLALRAAEVTAASGMVEISARRGDLTGLEERRAAERVARRGQRRELLVAALWLLWVVAPPFTPWTREAYAVAAPLWLLRAAPLRRRPPD